jgi:hypothetical protein
MCSGRAAHARSLPVNPPAPTRKCHLEQLLWWGASRLVIKQCRPLVEAACMPAVLPVRLDSILANDTPVRVKKFDCTSRYRNGVITQCRFCACGNAGRVNRCLGGNCKLSARAMIT